MIKILYIVSTLQRSGPLSVLYNLMAELDPEKFKPIILTLSPESAGYTSTRQSFLDIGVEIYSLDLNRLKGFFVASSKIKAFVSEHKINVIHLTGFRADLLVKPSNFDGTLIISTIHSDIYDDYTMLYGKVTGRIMARLHMNSLSGKIGIACSKFVSDSLNKRYGIALSVIRNGISKKRYAVTSESERFQILKELKLDHQKRNFTFVGSLIYRKNPTNVIKSFLKNENIANTHLLVVGDGPLREECERLCENNKESVSFFGNQADTLKFYKVSDYYISASYSEGLPMSVLEAMGCGLPVILSNITPHIELVSPLSKWSYLFPPDEINTLSREIEEILKDDHLVLSRKCRAVIDNHFNSELMALDYQLLYQKVQL